MDKKIDSSNAIRYLRTPIGMVAIAYLDNDHVYISCDRTTIATNLERCDASPNVIAHLFYDAGIELTSKLVVFISDSI